MKFTVVIPGQPQSKERPRLGRFGRTFTPQRTLEYEARVRDATLAVMPEGWRLDADYRVDFRLFVATKRRQDCDNVVKIGLDACNEVAYFDDCQVSQGSWIREYDHENPRLEVDFSIVALPTDKESAKLCEAHRAKLEKRAAKRRAKAARPAKKRLPRRRKSR